MLRTTFGTTRNYISLPLLIASRTFSTSRYKVDDDIIEDFGATKYSRPLKILGSKFGDHKLTHRKSPEKRILAIDRKYQDKYGVSFDESTMNDHYLPPFVLYNKFKNPELSKAMNGEELIVQKKAPLNLSEKVKAYQQSIKQVDLDRWVRSFVNRKRLPTAFELFHENQLQSVTEEWNRLTKDEKQSFVKLAQKSLKKSSYKPAFSFFLERYMEDIAKRWKEMSPLQKEPFQTRAHLARKRYIELFGNSKSSKKYTIVKPSFGLHSTYNAY